MVVFLSLNIMAVFMGIFKFILLDSPVLPEKMHADKILV